MKQAGIVGGLGPESTVDYYQSFIHKHQERMMYRTADDPGGRRFRNRPIEHDGHSR